MCQISLFSFFSFSLIRNTSTATIIKSVFSYNILDNVAHFQCSSVFSIVIYDTMHCYYISTILSMCLKVCFDFFFLIYAELHKNNMSNILRFYSLLNLSCVMIICGPINPLTCYPHLVSSGFNSNSNKISLFILYFRQRGSYSVFYMWSIFIYVTAHYPLSLRI